MTLEFWIKISDESWENPSLLKNKAIVTLTDDNGNIILEVKTNSDSKILC